MVGKLTGLSQTKTAGASACRFSLNLMMLRTNYMLALLFASAAVTFSQASIPQFKDFPARGKYAGKNAPVIITAKDRQYRTRLREAAKEKPNFAEHYILTAWGCGASCLMGAVIDANTGKVRWFPHAICCWNEIERDESFTPIVFRLNSRLVVFTGIRNEQDGDQGAHFYEFDTTGFKYIRTIKSTATQPVIHREKSMAKRNYLIEGGSGTGKSAVWEELQRRGYKAINGDRELAYKGDPQTENE